MRMMKLKTQKVPGLALNQIAIVKNLINAQVTINAGVVIRVFLIGSFFPDVFPQKKETASL